MRKPYGNKWIISFRLLTLLVIGPLLLWGQVERLSFHHLTPDGGLSQASNDFVYTDSKGFVWLSSLDGLNRFDGKEVKVYKSISGDSTSLLGNIINSSFFEDLQTNLWFTTYEGIHCYIREKDYFQHFQLENEAGELLKEDYRAFFLDADHQLWLRIGSGEKGRLHIFDIENATARIFCPIGGRRHVPISDQEGRLLKIVSTVFPVKKGIEVVDIQKKGARTSFFRGEKEDFPALSSLHARFDNPTIWYLGMQGGLALLDPQQGEVEFFSTYQGQAIGDVFSTENISDSICWVATAAQGVLVFHKDRRQFISRIPYEPDNLVGLHLNPVNQLHRDSNDNVWLTSFTSGVNFAQLNKRKFDLSDPFIGSSVSAIFETSEGAVFCSYGRGKTAFFSEATSPPQDAPMIVPDGVRTERIQFFVEEAAGSIWAAASNYLLQWNPDSRQFEYNTPLPNTILYLYQDRSGHILMSTYSGIYTWTSASLGIQIQPYHLLGEFQSELATAIYEDKKGRLYLALDAARLLVLEKKDGVYQAVRNIEGIGYAKAFHEEEELLWVATSTGILQINLEDLSSRLLNEEEDGAPNEFYYSILKDASGKFWLGCNRGIIRYDYERQSARRFTLSDGLQGNEYNSDAFLKTRKGEIWMGGVNGLNRFFPETIKNRTPAPKVQLTQLQVDDEPYPTKQQIEVLESLSLPYSNNTVSFHFAALEYSDPENNRFRYRLEPIEKDWVDGGKTGFARYANLPHGRYVFNVQAANSDGVWSDTPRHFRLHIQTPWWKSIWFYILVALAVSGIIYGIFVYRLRQALKIERMRVKISSDLHDDVGGLLSGLAMQSELLELTAPDDRKPRLQRISEMSRSAMSRMRDTVWAIDARKDKLENLLDRIREHAAETLEPRDIAFDIQVEELSLEKNISSQLRQNLYLICKEAITNAAKHTNGDRMEVRFVKSGRKGLIMTIYDNGKFVQKEHKTTGLGMSNMQMRAEQIDATFEIDTQNGFLIRVQL